MTIAMSHREEIKKLKEVRQANRKSRHTTIELNNRMTYTPMLSNTTFFDFNQKSEENDSVSSSSGLRLNMKMTQY